MPDIVVHTEFGKEVKRHLPFDVDRDIYRFGLLGPDPFLFYRFYVPPFRHRVNRYSSVMHREHTGEFLMALSRRAKNNEEVFSYLCGFLCHYALDSVAHPYINEKAGFDPVMHMAIEHRLDKMSGENIRIPPFLPSSMRDEVGGAIREVYGFTDAWEKLREGRRDMAPFFRIVSDSSGRLDRFAHMTRSKLKLVSYQSKEIEGMDLSGFAPLYHQALCDAERFINAAKSCVDGEIGEEELHRIIGSRSYIDG